MRNFVELLRPSIKDYAVNSVEYGISFCSTSYDVYFIRSKGDIFMLWCSSIGKFPLQKIFC